MNDPTPKKRGLLSNIRKSWRTVFGLIWAAWVVLTLAEFRRDLDDAVEVLTQITQQIDAGEDSEQVQSVRLKLLKLQDHYSTSSGHKFSFTSGRGIGMHGS